MRRFTRADVERLRDGLPIESMDDHWASAMHGRGVDFYRSWTGTPIYRLRLFNFKDGGLSLWAWVSLSPRAALFALVLAPIHPLVLRHLVRSTLAGRPSG
ncbi:MAG TPA: hypothetical protein VF796_26845 [Humisphaera sp.]